MVVVTAQAMAQGWALGFGRPANMTGKDWAGFGNVALGEGCYSTGKSDG
jgi:hypothetical protein